MEFIHTLSSPLGPITLASDGTYLTGLWFDGQKHFAAGLSPDAISQELDVFTQTESWLACYFQGKVPTFTPALRPSGTPFQKAVWEILLSIPFGHTITYGQIGKLLAQQSGLSRIAGQAVGNAVGRNPISLIIPCHRVLGSGGSLTGYAGGLDRKVSLLELEGCCYRKPSR